MEVLTDKQYRSYDRFSRYAPVPYYYHNLDDKYVYGTSLQLRTDTPYILHTVKEGETLDSIALEAYNNPTYFYLIAEFNHILDPYVKLSVGQQLKVPTFSSVAYKGI